MLVTQGDIIILSLLPSYTLIIVLLTSLLHYPAPQSFPDAIAYKFAAPCILLPPRAQHLTTLAKLDNWHLVETRVCVWMVKVMYLCAYCESYLGAYVCVCRCRYLPACGSRGPRFGCLWTIHRFSTGIHSSTVICVHQYNISSDVKTSAAEVRPGPAMIKFPVTDGSTFQSAEHDTLPSSWALPCTVVLQEVENS